MIHLRQAQRSDADAIAHLHTAGWRDTYTKVMSADFLENQAQEDRLSHWRSALNQSNESETVFVAEYDGKVEGFICIKLHYDAQWGCYIDSLHVSSSLRGHGVGKQLLWRAAEWVKSRDDESPLYLWVFEDNTQATAFYQRLGGTIVERTLSDMPSSDHAPVFRISWKNAGQLLTTAC
ncbi:GNAT family N-acetyltransferase [Pantoea stewartii]|uniref:GNAT family N-acetyltransferase n=1 Tax=Pantoea stewartii TaxID=66269 RepID=UPI0019822E21